MTTIAIISARGGSKRLPGKNIMDFCGRPLIAWSIIAARACPLIDTVFVNTDSDEIAEISRQYGANVLMRQDPRESFDETSGGVPQGFAALRIEKMWPVDAFVCLFPTSPLRKPTDLGRFVQAYEKTRERFIGGITIKDVYIHKKIDDWSHQQLIMTKNSDYLYEVGGTAILGRDYYHKPQLGPGSLVDWDDLTTWQEQPAYELEPGILHYILFEDWQKHEIDYQSDFDICEFLFERYLLAEWEAIYKQLEKQEV